MKNKNKIPSYIRNFCSSFSNQTPIVVPIRPVISAPLNECFAIVPEHIKSNGGSQQFGWCIHIWKKVMIEAEFHSIWQSPKGELIDITPKIEKGNFIIFIPDPNRTYDGKQVSNFRHPISNDAYVSEFIALAEEYFRYINRGDLADYHGEIEIGSDFINQYHRMMELELLLTNKFGNNRCLSS